MKTCPECAEEIKLEAKVCRFCGTTFSVVQAGYCTSCHKVRATSELGVCVVCSSRLIDVHLESLETTGPTVGSGGEKSEQAPASVAALAPVEKPRLDNAEEQEKVEGEEQEEEEQEEGKAPAPSLVAFTEPKPDLVPAPSPPGLPTGLSWVKSAPADEPTNETEEPSTADEASEEEAQSTRAAEPGPKNAVEKLGAFGSPLASSAIPASTPPPGPPVAPPPGPPATTPPVITPSLPVSSTAAEQAAKAAPSAPPARVDLRPEPAKEEAEQVKPVEPEAPVAGAGRRLGIVPSLTHRIAHPLYQLAAIVVILVWLLEYYWDQSLRGTGDPGSKALSHLVVATYGDGRTLLIAVQVAAVAAICGLLAPTRLLPKGWFRNRKVTQAFAKELQSSFGVKMIYQQKWYLQKMICAFVIWAIALAYFVWGIARESSVDLKIGGYMTAVALLVGFVCSALLMTRRTPLVAVDANGRIEE
jgi:hypothetical protein